MSVDFTTFEQECLDEHNRLRAQHGCPPLALNQQICKYAQDWANFLATNNKLEHRDQTEYGENLFVAEGMDVDGTTAVQSWYDEIKDYDFTQPQFEFHIGHFTQVIWKSTKEIGVGIQKRDNKVWVVVNYSPPGNFIGLFAEHVPRVDPTKITKPTSIMKRHSITSSKESIISKQKAMKIEEPLPEKYEKPEIPEKPTPIHDSKNTRDNKKEKDEVSKDYEYIPLKPSFTSKQNEEASKAQDTISGKESIGSKTKEVVIVLTPDKPSSIHDSENVRDEKNVPSKAQQNTISPKESVSSKRKEEKIEVDQPANATSILDSQSIRDNQQDKGEASKAPDTISRKESLASTIRTKIINHLPDKLSSINGLENIQDEKNVASKAQQNTISPKESVSSKRKEEKIEVDQPANATSILDSQNIRDNQQDKGEASKAPDTISRKESLASTIRTKIINHFPDKLSSINGLENIQNEKNEASKAQQNTISPKESVSSKRKEEKIEVDQPANATSIHDSQSIRDNQQDKEEASKAPDTISRKESLASTIRTKIINHLPDKLSSINGLENIQDEKNVASKAQQNTISPKESVSSKRKEEKIEVDQESSTSTVKEVMINRMPDKLSSINGLENNRDGRSEASKAQQNTISPKELVSSKRKAEKIEVDQPANATSIHDSQSTRDNQQDKEEASKAPEYTISSKESSTSTVIEVIVNRTPDKPSSIHGSENIRDGQNVASKAQQNTISSKESVSSKQKEEKIEVDQLDKATAIYDSQSIRHNQQEKEETSKPPEYTIYVTESVSSKIKEAMLYLMSDKPVHLENAASKAQQYSISPKESVISKLKQEDKIVPDKSIAMETILLKKDIRVILKEKQKTEGSPEENELNGNQLKLAGGVYLVISVRTTRNDELKDNETEPKIAQQSTATYEMEKPEETDVDIKVPKKTSAKNDLGTDGPEKTSAKNDVETDIEVPEKTSAKNDLETDIGVPEKTSAKNDLGTDIEVPEKTSAKNDLETDIEVPEKTSAKNDLGTPKDRQGMPLIEKQIPEQLNLKDVLEKSTKLLPTLAKEADINQQKMEQMALRKELDELKLIVKQLQKESKSSNPQQPPVNKEEDMAVLLMHFQLMKIRMRILKMRLLLVQLEKNSNGHDKSEKNSPNPDEENVAVLRVYVKQ